MTSKSIKSKINIDSHIGALILIDMLFAQKLIDKQTYDNIQEKYNNKNKQIKQGG